MEYRIGFDITKQVLTIIQLKLYSFLDTNPFYIIPTQLVSKVKIAKLKTFLNLYNLSFNSPLQSIQSSEFNNETFRICLLILMKTINQSFDALPNTKKYFGDSSIDNPKNTGTLEIHAIMKKFNTAWLLSEIFNIDNYSTIITSQYFQQNQQPTNNNNNNDNIDPEIKINIRRLVTIITSEPNYNNEMVELVEFIWTQFIIDCIESIPSNYKTNNRHDFIELNQTTLDTYITKNQNDKRMYSINPVSRCGQYNTRETRFNMYFNHTRDREHTGQGWNCRLYLKSYKEAFKAFNELNSLDLFEDLKNRLYLEFQKQRIVPKSENNGKFCVTYKQKVYFTDLDR